MNKPLNAKSLENGRWLAKQALHGDDEAIGIEAALRVCALIPRYDATVDSLREALDTLFISAGDSAEPSEQSWDIASAIMDKIFGEACPGCYTRDPHFCKADCALQTRKARS